MSIACASTGLTIRLVKHLYSRTEFQITILAIALECVRVAALGTCLELASKLQQANTKNEQMVCTSGICNALFMRPP